VKKIFEINERLLGTIAGGAADCMFWFRTLNKIIRVHELKHKERLTATSASKLLADMLAQYRGYGLSVGTMISGFDGTTPALYFVDNDGTRIKGNVFSVGSGSTYAYGVMDTEYNYDMTLEQAIDLGKRAIYHAGHRDAMSGGEVNLYHVHADGWTKILNRVDLNVFHYENEAKNGMTNYLDDVLNY
jgi:20S proteasome subunit beta 5